MPGGDQLQQLAAAAPLRGRPESDADTSGTTPGAAPASTPHPGCDETGARTCRTPLRARDRQTHGHTAVHQARFPRRLKPPVPSGRTMRKPPNGYAVEMTVIGFHCSHEQIDPAQLLRDVQQAEQAGFTAGMSSDHFSPWSARQGESGFAWSFRRRAGHRQSCPSASSTRPGSATTPRSSPRPSPPSRRCFLVDSGRRSGRARPRTSE